MKRAQIMREEHFYALEQVKVENKCTPSNMAGSVVYRCIVSRLLPEMIAIPRHSPPRHRWCRMLSCITTRHVLQGPELIELILI